MSITPDIVAFYLAALWGCIAGFHALGCWFDKHGNLANGAWFFLLVSLANPVTLPIIVFFGSAFLVGNAIRNDVP